MVDSDAEAQDWGLDVFSRHGHDARDAYGAGFDNGKHACGCRWVGACAGGWVDAQTCVSTRVMID